MFLRLLQTGDIPSGGASGFKIVKQCFVADGKLRRFTCQLRLSDATSTK